MRKLLLSLSLAAIAVATMASELQFVDASKFPLLGATTEASANRYNRLPDSLQGKVRKPLIDLGYNTAGMAVRFRSNTTKIGARWKARNVFNMNHMTPTGIRGLDLYCLQDDGTWTFVNSGRPGAKATTKSTLMENMEKRDREYMLYLPLYDGIDSLEIGIDSLATISAPAIASPRTDKVIVWYGTSILQGGCANRPGMGGTSIISRRLNCEIKNLGFSGNARLDPELAKVMAALDANVYVLDMLPNVTTPQLKERLDKFYNILRAKRPTTPIVFVESPRFPNMRFNTETNRLINEKNATLREFFDKFRKAGDRNIYYVKSEGMIGDDNEATVDNAHFTDLGFMRFADFMVPHLKRFVK